MYGQGIGKAGFTSKHTLHSVQVIFLYKNYCYLLLSKIVNNWYFKLYASVNYEPELFVKLYNTLYLLIQLIL